MQFLVFCVLAGVGGIAASYLSAADKLHPEAALFWALGGFLGLPALVCLLTFVIVWFRTPVRQRNEARAVLLDLRDQVGDISNQVESLTTERDQARAQAEKAPSSAPAPQITNNYFFGEDPDPGLTARLRAKAEAGATDQTTPNPPEVERPDEPQEPQIPPERTDNEGDEPQESPGGGLS